MINEICHELKNWFEVSKIFDTFTISNGSISCSQNLNLQDGQYFRIVGSIFNDGVYQYPTSESDLTDEIFEGAIWPLAIPKEIIELSNEVDEWNAKYGGVDSEAMSPFASESFGGYSYSKSGGGASDGSSNAGTWQGVYATRLNKWRKIR